VESVRARLPGRPLWNAPNKALSLVAATRPNREWGYSTRRHVLEAERPEAVLPDRALCLPTFSHFLIVNKLSPSRGDLPPLSLPPSLPPSLSPSLPPSQCVFSHTLTSFLYEGILGVYGRLSTRLLRFGPSLAGGLATLACSWGRAPSTHAEARHYC
jgi:hypothetical protein